MKNKKSTNQLANLANRVSLISDTTISKTLKYASQPGIISLAGGIPNSKLFPLDEVRAELNTLISEDELLRLSLQYSQTGGLPTLKEAIAKKTSQEWQREITSDQILITTGSQQALDLLGKAFINTNNQVIVENPTYLAAISAFKAYGPNFLTIELNDSGPDIDQLESHLEKSKPKIFYCIPTFQNPTGITWSKDRRLAAAALCREKNVTIIEDDPYSNLSFEEKMPLPIAAGDITNQTIYLGTFSKTLFPGLRIGYIIANSDLINTLTLVKQSMDLHSSTFSQLLISLMLTKPGFMENHIQNLQNYYKTSSQNMMMMLKEFMPNKVEWTVPNGGLFTWLKIPGINSLELLKKSVENGIAFMPGYPFYANEPDPTTIRLTYATATKEDMAEAIKKLAITLKH